MDAKLMRNTLDVAKIFLQYMDEGDRKELFDPLVRDSMIEAYPELSSSLRQRFVLMDLNKNDPHYWSSWREKLQSFIISHDVKGE